jgi:spermidine synthase
MQIHIELREQPITAAVIPVMVGVTAVTGQIVLLREVMVVFNGNELSLGLVLAAWMIWTAVGSGLVDRFLPRRAHLFSAVGVLGCFWGFSLIPTIVAVRAARGFLQAAPGELLSPSLMAIVSLVSLSVFCLCSGCMFALAARLYRQAAGSSGELALAYAYLLETVGSALGGILAGIVLLRFFSPFQIAILIALPNVCLLPFLVFRTWACRILVLSAAPLSACALMIFAAPRMERSTHQSMWSGFSLVALRDSVYGRLAVLKLGDSRSIYENGGVIANIPDQAAAEETVHYALLEHPAPRRILLIGGGLNGGIAEAIKHPTVERVDYVELDPALIEMAEKDLPAESGLALSDPRVRVHSRDGRLYLNSTSQRFDEVLINVPDPDNAQLNRFYTAEFFRIVRDRLAPGGVLALELRSSEESIGPELADFLRCIYKTLQTQFPQVAVIPGDMLHMFGALQTRVLTEDSRVLIERLETRGIQTMYVRAYSLPFRMAPDRMAQIHDILRPLPDTPANRDARPAAYYFAAMLWTAQFKPGGAYPLKLMAQIRFPVVLLSAAFLSLVAAFVWWFILDRSRRAVAAWSIISTGYTLVALQILLLLSFQSLYGYVYRELALLIGTFMAGIAFGSWRGIVTIRISSGETRIQTLMRKASVNQVTLAVSAPLLLLAVFLLSRVGVEASETIVALVGFPLLGALSGVPGGYQFSIASALYHHDRQQQASLGALYALDLVGGCLGALLLAGFLIPLFGFWNNAWLSALVGAAPAAIGFLAGRSRRT